MRASHDEVVATRVRDSAAARIQFGDPRMRTMYDSMLRVGVPDVNMRVCTVPLRPPDP